MKPLVSIDIFDTAIFRKVFRPTDIFNIIEDEVGMNFKELRIKAQDKAAAQIPGYTILDIYKFLPQFNPREEIRAEYYNCKANPYILDMYNNGEADYIFISDMYLPSSVLRGMLEHCGYENPEVYVSCELGACKGNGKLFEKVEGIVGRKISKHIGDNYNCDILGAKRVGIPEQEFVGPAIYDREVVTPELENVKLRKLLIDEELSDSSIEEKIGYLFAPLTLAFTQSVLDEATDDQTIFFNARDGYIMYIVARWLLKTKKKIKYCRFSRKSCYIPALDTSIGISEGRNQPIFDFLKVCRCYSVRDFLSTYGLNESKNYEDILNLYYITLDTNLEFHPKRIQILGEAIKLLQNDFYKIAKKRKESFIQYVERLGMKDGDFFVDLGYNGSMQAMIKRITDKDLKGRYMTTINLAQSFAGVELEKKSFLDINFFGFYGAVVELVFSEPKGTVQEYQDGFPKLSSDIKFRKDTTKKLLKGVLKGVTQLLEEGESPLYTDCQEIIKRFLHNPTLEEATFANNDLFENGSLKKNENVVNFREESIRMGKVKESYQKSYWKTAFKVLLRNSSKYKSLERVIK